MNAIAGNRIVARTLADIRMLVEHVLYPSSSTHSTLMRCMVCNARGYITPALEHHRVSYHNPNTPLSHLPTMDHVCLSPMEVDYTTPVERNLFLSVGDGPNPVASQLRARVVKSLSMVLSLKRGFVINDLRVADSEYLSSSVNRSLHPRIDVTLTDGREASPINQPPDGVRSVMLLVNECSAPDPPPTPTKSQCIISIHGQSAYHILQDIIKLLCSTRFCASLELLQCLFNHSLVYIYFGEDFDASIPLLAEGHA